MKDRTANQPLVAGRPVDIRFGIFSHAHHAEPRQNFAWVVEVIDGRVILIVCLYAMPVAQCRCTSSATDRGILASTQLAQGGGGID